MATVFALPEAEAIERGDADEAVSALDAAIAEGGDLSSVLTSEQLATLGADVVADYERDCSDRDEWYQQAKNALDAASQEIKGEAKNYPFANASDVRYPILTIAAIEFNARAYPAIVKGDETVQVKVIGADRGRPMMGPDGPLVLINDQPVPMTALPQIMAQAAAMGQEVQPQPAWAVPPGAKAKRASRVKDYMNVVINYRMDDWEADTDLLLLQLPIVGCGFRKTWWDREKGVPIQAFVSALKLAVPQDARSIADSPRVTEEVPDVFPFQIRRKMRDGVYRTVDLPNEDDDKEKPRLLLEQHRLIDLDETGDDRRYIVTVDKATSEVLRIEAAEESQAFYTKYEFIPHPKGNFYSIGFGHLLGPLSDVIDTTINMIIDAEHARIAGGGFIAGGVRLQGNGQTSNLTWQPGEYKLVNAQAGALKEAIWERTFPNQSPIMFQVLDFMLAAAKNIAAVRDVTSGDASNQGQVGTTLALIEQGLMVFNGIYKRIYRGFRSDFQMIFDNLAAYGDERTAKDYMTVLDDPEADFAKDFDGKDFDIRPVSDPNNVTRIQKMARAQFLLQTGTGNSAVDQHELMMRAYEAADIEDLDKLLPPPNNQPPPQLVAEVEKIGSEANRNNAQAELYRSQVAEKGLEAGMKLGAAEGDEGRLSGMGGEPGNAVGVPGGEDRSGGPAGGMAPPELGTGAGGPADPM